MRRRSMSLFVVSAILFVVFALLAWVVRGATSFSTVWWFDHVVDGAVSPFRSSHILSRLMLAVTYLGNPEVITLFGIVVLACLLAFKRIHIAFLFAAGAFAGEGVSLFFKYAFERARPPETLFHVSRFGFAFPSWHALMSTIFYGLAGFFLAHITRSQVGKVCIASATTVVILAIGFSRIFLGVHWPTDVLGGWLLGGAFLALTTALFYHIHQHNEGERVGKLDRLWVKILIAIIAIAGLALAYFVVTHMPEFRSIV